MHFNKNDGVVVIHSSQLIPMDDFDAIQRQQDFVCWMKMKLLEE